MSTVADQTGKFVLITGATGGLGFQAAKSLAGAGAEVLLTGRDADKGARALSAIRAVHPNALVRFELLDLAALGSVRRFVDRFTPDRRQLDLLINNAGIMAPRHRQQSADGVELQFATNYLGHFALTAGLLPAIVRSKAPRIVQVSSVMARQGTPRLATAEANRAYNAMEAYSDSKLAQLLFMVELQRRSERGGWNLTSLAAHPGVARTDLIANGPGRESFSGLMMQLIEPVISQPVEMAVLPILHAATHADVQPLDYFGPGRWFELKGPPGRAKLPELARDEGLAARLWRLSEDLSDTRFPVLPLA